MGALVRLAAIAAALLAAAPPLLAHGNECLFARVAPGEGGDITVELMADVAGNPLIPDASEARSILAGALQVRIGDHRYRLEELGSISFEQRTRLADDAPVPPGAVDGTHQLLTAVWHARLPSQNLTFVTPEHTPHDVLLWDNLPTAPGVPRWMLLICGEESRAYALPIAASTSQVWMGISLLVILIPLLGLLGARLRSSFAAVVPATGKATRSFT